MHENNPAFDTQTLNPHYYKCKIQTKITSLKMSMKNFFYVSVV